jgi:hypothetical protein
MLKKQIWVNFQRIEELFTQKIVTMLSKIWVWDPGSGIRRKPIPDPGLRGQNSDPGSGSATLEGPKVSGWFRIKKEVLPLKGPALDTGNLRINKVLYIRE